MMEVPTMHILYIFLLLYSTIKYFMYFSLLSGSHWFPFAYSREILIRITRGSLLKLAWVVSSITSLH